LQVKPSNPPNITPEDLAACGMSGTFFSVLSDVKQFFDYNYREVSLLVFHGSAWSAISIMTLLGSHALLLYLKYLEILPLNSHSCHFPDTCCLQNFMHQDEES
jgi:hypothetical protein